MNHYGTPAKLRSTRRINMRAYLDAYKVRKGCVSCGYRGHPAALQFAHRDGVTKYRTQSGRVVHPSDMVGRYSPATILREIDLCDVKCSNCHAIETHG